MTVNVDGELMVYYEHPSKHQLRQQLFLLLQKHTLTLVKHAVVDYQLRLNILEAIKRSLHQKQEFYQWIKSGSKCEDCA